MDVQGPTGLVQMSDDPIIRCRPACRFTGDPRAAAGRSWEAIMASLVVLMLVAIVVGALVGAFLKLSFAIRREDRRMSLRFDAPDRSAQSARALVGISSSRWDD
jgi:hypothetical protein